ncbi:hypothetical protein Glove_1g26 [Diversispora epigaea]|uniref:Uncharacterized protein n=1 Tax=Diversispora epigaea TaxID=1348612 RepID=A0A397JZN4_9GLOM|nr:hypothetical protein Glove_1g26 [Diversispora epigaea]
MEQIYQEFDQYDFENDINFQSGLPLILQSQQSQENKSKEDIDQIIKKAKWFYFSKVVKKFDYNDYLVWKKSNNKLSPSTINEITEINENKSSSSTINETTEINEITGISDNSNSNNLMSQETPQYPKSFQQVIELITSGQPIPGIKKIPNEINKETPSHPKLEQRKKPWEKKD